MPSDNSVVNIWEQCNKNKKCFNGVCIHYSPYYSQCLPYELDKNMLCGQNDNKEINWYYNKCKNNMKCVQLVNSIDYRCLWIKIECFWIKNIKCFF